MFQRLNQLKWNTVLIQKVEIVKMASKMAVSYASKTYMTDILDENILIWTFYGCLKQRPNDTNDQRKTWF